MRQKIHVLLADDHAVLRAGLRMLIDAQPDMDVIAEVGDGDDAVRQAVAQRPDVAIVDLSMPGKSGIEVIHRLREHDDRIRVLVLTMHDDPAYARVAVAAGAAGYVTKDVDASEVLAAIRAVHRGRTYLQFAHRSEPQRAEAAPARGASRPLLSAREQQVLELLARGYTNRQVAERLSLSVKTVETYRARLGEKLGLRTRADLVRFAMEIGLLAPDLDSPDLG